MKTEPFAPSQTFDDFCETHGIELVARQRSKRSQPDESMRWYVSGERLEIMGNGILTSTHGNGATPEEAVSDYAERLAGQRLVLSGRREFNAPNEWLS